MWLIVALGGYFLNGIAAIIDKILLKSSVPHPKVYAFFISILGLLALVVAPYGLTLPSVNVLLASGVAGVFFLLALITLFTGLKRGEASRVVPLVGSIQPLGIYILSYGLLGERLNALQVGAFALLVLGGVVLSVGERKAEKRQGWVVPALMSGVLFAGFYVVTKYIFLNTDFVNGFLWPRIFTAALAMFLLLERETRVMVFNAQKTLSPLVFFVFLFGQIAGSASFILIQYAISLASATLVNALQGTQYAFVFLLTVFFTLAFPRLLKEPLRFGIVAQKLLALCLIGVGVALLACM